MLFIIIEKKLTVDSNNNYRLWYRKGKNESILSQSLSLIPTDTFAVTNWEENNVGEDFYVCQRYSVSNTIYLVTTKPTQ